MKKNIISKSLLSEVADSSIILDVRNEDDVSNAKPYDKVPNSVFVKFDQTKVATTFSNPEYVFTGNGIQSSRPRALK